MSSFAEEAGKLLGLFWHREELGKSKTYASKHARITARAEKLYQKYIDLYTKIDHDSGQTYAKILYDLKHPQWFKLIHTLPQDVLDTIKEKSGIKD